MRVCMLLHLLCVYLCACKCVHVGGAYMCVYTCVTYSTSGGWLVRSIVFREGGGVKHYTENGSWLVTGD